MTVTALPARATSTLDRFEWTSTKSQTVLSGGRPMTASEAVAYISSSFSNANEVVVVSDRRVSFRSAYGCVTAYVGTRPLPDDPHAAVNDLAAVVLDWSPTTEQAEHLIEALRAAADGNNEAAVAGLMAMLATPMPS